jgi:hypothetical protein
VVRGTAPGQPLFVPLHGRGGSFLQMAHGTSRADEWRLLPDDPLWNMDQATWWYGYHESYDPFSDANQPPTSGMVHDYTLERVIYTLLWARRNFPCDTNRVYVAGPSMGAIGAVLVTMSCPDLVAAGWSSVGKVDFSDLDDPAFSAFDPGGPLRAVTDRQWGSVWRDLPTDGGLPVYDRQNYGLMAARAERSGLPPMIYFHGKLDSTMGWGEKPPFYATMQQHRHGGYFFWDPRGHNDSQRSAWYPMQDLRSIYRYRLDRSYPALSHCSADFDPGDGTAASGDSVGTINGFVEWDTTLVDLPHRWQVRLYLRDLTTLWGTLPAPDSLTVDVTPRRLQHMLVTPGNLLAYTVARLPDSAVVQSGTVVADSLGLVTLPAAVVYRGGSLVALQLQGPVGVGPAPSGPAAPLVLLPRHPLRGSATLTVVWPHAGDARLDLLDVSGRLVRNLQRGPAPATQSCRLDAAGLRSGVYFLLARQGPTTTVRRLVLLRQ